MRQEMFLAFSFMSASVEEKQKEDIYGKRKEKKNVNRVLKLWISERKENFLKSYPQHFTNNPISFNMTIKININKLTI